MWLTDSDKPTLHQDAKRLFSSETTAGEEWNSTYDMHYKSGKEAGRHALRDATAFATVALPSHYSAIYAVFEQVKQRLGPGWQVDRVIDWGAATGSGLWFVANCPWKWSSVITRFLSQGVWTCFPAAIRHGRTQFTRHGRYPDIPHESRELPWNRQTGGPCADWKAPRQRYVPALEPCQTQLTCADVDLGGVSVAWQKSFHEGDAVDSIDGSNVVALSAFLLSSLPTHVDRKVLVKEMWESGAEVIVSAM